MKADVLGIKAVIAESGAVSTLGLLSVATFAGSGIVELTPGVFVVELLSVGKFACTAVVGLTTAVEGGGEIVAAPIDCAVGRAPRTPVATAWLGSARRSPRRGPLTIAGDAQAAAVARRSDALAATDLGFQSQAPEVKEIQRTHVLTSTGC